MHGTLDRSTSGLADARGGDITFVPVRADRAALGAHRLRLCAADDDALLLCRQAAGACTFRTGPSGGRLISGDMILVDGGAGVDFEGDVAATERLILPRRRLPAPSAAIEAAHGLLIAARSPLGVVLGSLIDALRCGEREPAKQETPEDALMRALFAALASAVVEGPSELIESDPLLGTIRDHVEANLGDETLSPETIARHFGLSRASLYRLWRPLGGVAGHVRERRLARAKLLLSEARHRRTTIAEIAYACGFRDADSFTHIYRRRFGCSPKETASERLPRRPRRADHP